MAAMAEAVEEKTTFDLIVVGGGMSGLSGRVLFSASLSGQGTIIIPRYHDDFGGPRQAERERVSAPAATVLIGL